MVDVSGRFDRLRWIGGDGMVSGRCVMEGWGGTRGDVLGCKGRGGDSELDGEVE